MIIRLHHNKQEFYAEIAITNNYLIQISAKIKKNSKNCQKNKLLNRN
jgi:hypothetical protein